MTQEPAHAYWVGVDLGATKLMATVFDSEYNVLGKDRRKTKANEGAEAGIGRIEKVVRLAVEQAGIEMQQIGAVGIGSPGALNLDEGSILESTNLGWRNVPLRKALESALGFPVCVINDVDAGVYGEYSRGVARGARCAIGVFPGTGIGAGCVYEGRLIRGAVSSCMEIGHIPVVPDGQLCGCGCYGCLETVASRLAIAGAAAAAAHRGEAPHLLEIAGCNVSKMRTGVLLEAIEAGDTAVEKIVRSAASWLGRAIAALVSLLAPDCVVLGGGLVQAMPGLYCDEVSASVAAHVMPSYREIYRVVAAELGDDACVTGAAAWARHVSETTGVS